MDCLGDRLRHGRRRMGLTQEALARASGVGVATVRRAELGAVVPRPSTLLKLADALGLRVPWLSIGEEPMTEGEAGR